jgi:WD40 repeat protein
MNWLRLWDVGAQREIANVPSVVCSDIQFSPDGALLAVATRNQVVFFDLAAGKQGLTLTCNSQVNSVAFDHTGHRVAIGESRGVVRVVDLTTGTTALTFNHDDAVLGVAFSPDGKFLATGSRDHSARLWDLQSGKEISRILHRGSLSTVGFSASGKFLISATTNFTQRSFWRLEDLITDACGRVAHNMSAEDWRQFLGDEPIRKTCVDLP